MEIPAHLRVTRVIVKPIQASIAEEDRRYRVLVNLQRSDRPKIWTFHCPQCRRPLSELLNADVISLSDTFDPTNYGNVSSGLRCDTRNCRFWYYFNLNT